MFTRDNNFEETYTKSQNKEELTMCEVVENFINKGISQGFEKAEEKMIFKAYNKFKKIIQTLWAILKYF